MTGNSSGIREEQSRLTEKGNKSDRDAGSV